VTLPHVDALDGLRGVAVAGVLLFHGGHLTGGYLGVDLFFVLSGFLITSLLLAESRERGTIGLGAFWARRARRLLPALAGLLVGVAVYAAAFAPAGELERIRGDALATMAYVANWHSIASGQDYWALFRAPSPLEHAWSLAIEEQFYLVWPLVFVGLLAWWRERVAHAVLVTAVVLAAASTALMVATFDPANPSRAYFGTDTRATGILLGAALAAAFAGWGHVRGRPGRVGIEVAGWLGVATLAFAWTRLDGQSARLYDGGFLVCALAAVLVIAAATHPERGPLARALSWRPLCLLGIISYGLYLWHWPVDLVLDETRTGLTGWSLFMLQTAVAVGIAVVSFRFLERPIRRGALTGRQWAVVTPALAVTLAVVVVVGTVGSSSTPAAARVENPAPSGARSAVGHTVGRVLVVGDSVAGTLTSGLRDAGLDVAESTYPGCRIVRGTIDIDEPALRPSRCPWPQTWADAVDRTRPQMVVLESAAFELWNVQPPGSDRWLVPGTKAWGRYWKGEMQQAVDVLSADGATVVVPTVACTEPSPTTPEAVVDRSPFNPARVRAANRVLRALARENAARMRLVDLAGFVCPEGRYRRSLDGVDPLRVDGVHYSPAGSDLVGRWLAQRLRDAAPATATPVAPVVPTAPTAPAGREAARR